MDGSAGGAKEYERRRADTRKLVTFRFVDAFGFAFAWIAVGLWAARTGGAASFAAVTSTIYLAYPAAVLTVGPVVGRLGSRRTLTLSAAASGTFLTAAFIALRSGAPAGMLLTLVAAQSFAGSTASELVKHAVARQNVSGSLAKTQVAYRTGFGVGGLTAGLLLTSAADTAIAAAGVAAALLSTAALMAATENVPANYRPLPAGHIVTWLPGSLRGTLPLVALSVTVAPVVAVAPGVLAATHGPAAAGALAAAVAAGALAGPAARRACERRPNMYPAVAAVGALLIVGLADLRAALVTIPLAALTFDINAVRHEERIHALHPNEPGALALPGLIWSLGVGAAAVPAALAIGSYGAWAVAAAATAVVVTAHTAPRSAGSARNS